MDTVEINYFLLAVSILAGTSSGITLPVVFNKIPATWLCDYDEVPRAELYNKRIDTLKASIFFSCLFTIASYKLILYSTYAMATGIIAIWLLTLISISDYKYMIIPDQFVLLLTITSLFFISNIKSNLFGLIVGGGFFLAIGFLFQMVYKKDALGFGDIKLMSAVGLLTGYPDVILIIIITSFTSTIYFIFSLLLKKLKLTDSKPLAPFISLSVSIYILFMEEAASFANSCFPVLN